MGFKDNLQTKIRIDDLSNQVLRSMEPTDGSQRLDRDAMRELLAMSSYTHRRERDLDLFLKTDQAGKPFILVLDNELKLYRTEVDDVAMRKSPTVKEMVSIRNAIKILSDKDVVISLKADTLNRVKAELLEKLDLSYTDDDIKAIERDGLSALANGYGDGVIENLRLFAELLGWEPAPKTFQVSHCRIWGQVKKPRAGELVFGPLISCNLMYNSLKFIKTPISNLDKEALKRYQQILLSEEMPAEIDGAGAWAALAGMIPAAKGVAA